MQHNSGAKKPKLKLKDAILVLAAILLCVSAAVNVSSLYNTSFLGSYFKRLADIRKEDYWSGNYLSGMYATRQNDYNAAASFFSEALLADPKSDFLQIRALTLMLISGRFQEAFEIAQIVARNPNSPPVAQLTLALREIGKNDFQKAEKYVARIDDQGFEGIITGIIRSWIKVGQGNYVAAQKIMTDLSSNKAFSLLVTYHSALMADVANDQPKAEKLYTQLLSETENPPLNLLGSARGFFEKHGNKQKVHEIDQKFGNVDESGHPWEIKRYDTVSNAREGIAETLFGSASVYLRENYMEKASAYLRMTLFLTPQLDEAKILLGSLLEREHDYAASNQILSQIQKKSKFYGFARLAIARNLDAMQQFEKAKVFLSQLTQMQGDRLEALVTLADLYRKRENYVESARIYAEAINQLESETPAPAKVNGKYWVLYYAKGISLERSGQWQRSEGDFMKALELSPDQPDVLNYLGYTWLVHDKNLDMARTMIEKAADARPEDPHIIDSLGWALFKTGDYDKATQYLEQAVELMPYDVTVNDHLGDVYWHTNRQVEAKYQWQRALDSNPDKETAAEIERKIENGIADNEKTAEKKSVADLMKQGMVYSDTNPVHTVTH